MIDFSSEIKYKTSRSSGAGGQNVNKVETAVTAMWNVRESVLFSDEEKHRILIKLKNKINAEGWLQMIATEARTQLANKTIVTNRLLETVEKALYIPKKRIPTKPSKAKIQKRLDDKKRLSDKKNNRKFRF